MSGSPNQQQMDALEFYLFLNLLVCYKQRGHPFLMDIFIARTNLIIIGCAHIKMSVGYHLKCIPLLNFEKSLWLRKPFIAEIIISLTAQCKAVKIVFVCVCDYVCECARSRAINLECVMHWQGYHIFYNQTRSLSLSSTVKVNLILKLYL